jgi:hypothetical protein
MTREEISSDEGRDVDALLMLSDADLLRQLGARTEAIRKNREVAGRVELLPEPTVMAESAVTDVVFTVGKRIFRRVSREMYSLVCGDENGDAEDRKRVLATIGMDDAALASTITAILMSSFGMAPALATVAGALLVKRVFQPSGEEVCAYWKEHLD